MCVILILVCSSIVLKIRPTVAMSFKMLRSSASFDSPENMAYMRYHIVYDFVAVHFSDSGNSETDAILRSLASVLWYKPSKLSVSALTIIRSAASTLTWGIVVVIVRIFISISFICLLGFWWVLSLLLRFSFRFTSASGLFWFCALELLRYFTFFFVHRMCYMGI